MSRTIAIVGDGRAGGSFALALAAAGWNVTVHHHGDLRAGRDDPRPGADRVPAGADMVLLCVPDSAVAATAAAVEPDGATVVAHCSGSLGLDVLDPAALRAQVHPLASLPDPETGAERLKGAWFAVSGDPMAAELVRSLDGRLVEVPEGRRAAYHAAAAIASNHLVALVGQLERVADMAGVPLEAYRRLAVESLTGAFDAGPAAALTGPAARGDWETLRAHLGAIGSTERDVYLALAAEAARLAGRELPLGSD